jgi:hypothetical protein
MKFKSACVALLLLAGAPPAAVAVSHFPLPALPGAKKLQKPGEDPMKNVARAKAAVQALMTAATVEEMAKHVRQPDRALPRMKAHYGEAKPGPVKFEFGDQITESEKDGVLFVLLDIKVNFAEHYLVVEVPLKDGPAKVDWESYAGWCEMPWADFVKKGSDAAKEFRVAATLSDYFNFDYSDRKKFHCFRLVDKDDTETIFAYCEAESKTAKTLLKEIREQQKRSTEENAVPTQTFTLKLSMKAADAARKQAWIEDVICTGWVTP